MAKYARFVYEIKIADSTSKEQAAALMDMELQDYIHSNTILEGDIEISDRPYLEETST